MNDTQLEIQHFLITGTTPRNVMFVSQSLNRVVYLPEVAPVFWGDTRVDISEEAVYMQRYRHKTGEYIHIGMSKAHDVIVCTENAKRLFSKV